MPEISNRVLPILLLIASNIFMTFAWYGHLKFKASALWIAVLASWAIAFFEYWLAVPANRIGSNAGYSGAELKTMQEVITLTVFIAFSIFYLGEKKEVITLTVFIAFSIFYLGEKPTLNHLLGFALIAVGAAVVFRGPFR